MKDLIKLLTSQLHTIFGQEASIYALDGVTSENLTTAGWKAGEGRRNSWKKYIEISRILTPPSLTFVGKWSGMYNLCEISAQDNLGCAYIETIHNILCPHRSTSIPPNLMPEIVRAAKNRCGWFEHPLITSRGTPLECK